MGKGGPLDGDHVHDESNERWGNPKKFKSVLNKGPFEAIIGFVKIQLKSHIPCSPSTRNESLNSFLNNDNIVAHATSRHEPRLTRIDDFRHEGFESLHYNTRQKFVKGVAEANGPKLVNQLRVGHFQNKDQVCVSLGWRNCKLLKNFLNSLNDTRS